jgi:shikimate dehydrogenase
MINLALIGKDISHSSSPQFYRKHLWNLNQYDLLDFDHVEMLPSLEWLSKKYYGLNITSPYKKNYSHYLNKINTPDEIDAINCINLKNMSATNTDYLALQKLIPLWLTISHDKIYILGDGSMSKLVSIILNANNVSFKILSRKNGFNLELIDLSQFSPRPLIINTCSRSFPFQGNFPAESQVIDLNYGTTLFSKRVLDLKIPYQDGQSLFEIQAFESISFWNF